MKRGRRSPLGCSEGVGVDVPPLYGGGAEGAKGAHLIRTPQNSRF